MQKSTDFLDLIVSRYRQIHPAVTIVSIALFGLVLVLAGKSINDDVRNHIFLRDSGLSGTAVVTARHETAERHPSYSFDYQFSARRPDGSGVQTYTGSNEVSRTHYQQYAVGSRMPVKFDPRNPNNNHSDMSGHWETSDLVAQGVLEMLTIALPIGFLMLLLWMFTGWLVGLMRPKPAAQTFPGLQPAAAPPPDLPPAAAAIAAYSRFLVTGSVIVGLLAMASLVAAVLANPKSEVFSPLVILWLVGLFGAWSTVVFVRGRRLRALIKGR